MRAAVPFAMLVVGCSRAPSRDVGVPDAAAPKSSPIAAVALVDASVDAGSAIDASAAADDGARTVPLRRDDEGRLRLGESPGFPAVNRAGTEIVLLAHDQLDFAGTAVEHVVFRDVKTGRTRLDAMLFDEMGERGRAPAALAVLRRKSEASVARANARLAADAWRTLEASAGDGAPRVRFGSDLEVELPNAAPSQAVVPITVRRAGDGGAVTETVPTRIPALASQGGMVRPTTTGPCGWVQSIDGWADPQRRFVVLALHPAVSGDACTLRLESETTIVVPL